jgi:hypothetical protein
MAMRWGGTVVDILTSSGNVTLTLFLVLPLIPVCPYLSVYPLSPLLSSLSLSPFGNAFILFFQLSRSFAQYTSLPFHISPVYTNLTFPFAAGVVGVEAVLYISLPQIATTRDNS